MAIGAITLGGGYFNAKHCQTFKSKSAEDYADVLKILFYIFVGLFILWTIFSVYLMVRWKWLWMKVTFAPPKMYGEDVEDFHPGILGRSGTRISLDATKNTDRINYEVEKTYDDLEYPRP
jgi:hypothetical protein